MTKEELLNKISKQFEEVLDNCFYVKWINDNDRLLKGTYSKRQYNNAIILNGFLSQIDTASDKLNFLLIYTVLFGPFEREFSKIIGDNNELLIPEERIFYGTHSRFNHLYYEIIKDNNKDENIKEIDILEKQNITLKYLYNKKLFNNYTLDNNKDFSENFELLLNKLGVGEIFGPLVVFDFFKNLYFLSMKSSFDNIDIPILKLKNGFKEIKKGKNKHSMVIKNLMKKTNTSYQEIKDFIISQEYYNNDLDDIFGFLLEDAFCFAGK